MDQQSSLWRVSGIDLFVCLDIDSSESPNSEVSFPPAILDPPIGLRRDQGDQVLLSPVLENRPEEFSQAESMVIEAGEHLHNVTARSSLVTPPSVETVQTPSSPGELQLGEALPQDSLPWISAPDKEVRHFENEDTSFRLPTSPPPGGDLAIAMAGQPWESTATDCKEDVQDQIGAEEEEQFCSDNQLCLCDRICCDKHYSCPCDQICCEECPYCSPCPYMLPCSISCGGACEEATNELENGRDRKKGTEEDDLEEEDKFLTGPYKCIANRCWSPSPEDYEWPSSPARGAADPQGQLQSPRTLGEFRQGKWTAEFDEWELGVTDTPSSGSTSSEISSEDAVAVHDSADPDFPNERPVPLRLSPGIESFDAMEVRAACQLVELRNSDNSDTVTHEQSALEGWDRYKLGLPDRRDPEDELGRTGGKTPVSPPASHVDHEKIAHDVPPEQVEEPHWEYGMPAAMVIDRDHVFDDHVNEFNRRRASPSTTRGGEDFEEDDGEILDRPPRKRQYKSLWELM